jgi:phage gpG-like protein
MSEFSAGWTGDFREAGAGFSHFLDDVHLKRNAALAGIGLVLQNQIKNELSTPGRGRLRQRLARRVGRLGRRGSRTDISKAGRASAPGDPPAPDTGALRNSILYHADFGVHVVGTNQVQAAALEFGTNRAGRGHRTVILPRPYFRPALAKAQAEMGKAIAVLFRFGV